MLKQFRLKKQKKQIFYVEITFLVASLFLLFFHKQNSKQNKTINRFFFIFSNIQTIAKLIRETPPSVRRLNFAQSKTESESKQSQKSQVDGVSPRHHQHHHKQHTHHHHRHHPPKQPSSSGGVLPGSPASSDFQWELQAPSPFASSTVPPIKIIPREHVQTTFKSGAGRSDTPDSLAVLSPATKTKNQRQHKQSVETEAKVQTRV